MQLLYHILFKKSNYLFKRYKKIAKEISEGLEGTVDYVDDAGQIHMSWKNGSTLALNKGVDKFEILK